MISFAVLFLCAVTGLVLGSTLKPLQEMNMEDAVLSLSKQIEKIQEELLVEIKRVERNYLADKIEVSSKLEQVLNKVSEIEKSSNVAIRDVSDSLQVEKNKLLLMNNHLLAEVLELRKRDLDTFEKIANVESEVSRDRVKAELLQVRLNETANMTHSCLASQTQIQDTMQKNIERLNVIEVSNLSARMGNVENSFKALRQDLDYVSNRQDDSLKLTVQNNTNDIGQLKQELSRIQTICSPPCENGGQCVKNFCNCTPSFTGDRCQQAVCSPPCENGGECIENNICKCTTLFSGDRCQEDWQKCGVDFDNGGNSGRGNTSSNLVWPWMAAVYKNYTSGPAHVCGGSIIHRHFVLTSSSCLIHFGMAGLSVKLGFSDLKKGTHLQKYRVQSVHKHPQYIHSSFTENHGYNIALLELEEPILFGPFVRPVCLPPPDIPQDELFYKPQSTAKAVYLYEYISSPQTSSPTVLNLTIRSQEECGRKIKEKNWEKYYPSPDLSFCTESSTKCPEHGSPLMQSRPAGDGARTWTQVGIRNWVDNNCKYFFSPRLGHLRAWVEATIAASSNP